MATYSQNLIKNLRQLRNNWKMKSPKQKWQIIYNLGAFCGNLVGVRVLTDMKLIWYTAVPGLIGINYFITAINAFVYYYKRDQLWKGVESFSAVGVVVSNLLMYWMAIGPLRFKANMSARFSGQFIYRDDNKPSKYHALCEKQVQRLIYNIISVLSLIVIGHIVFCIGPLYVIIFENQLTTFYGAVFPFTDPETYTGWIVNFTLQIGSAKYSMCGNFIIEIAIASTKNAIETMPLVIQLDLEELADELKMNGNNRKTRAMLRNTLMKIQDFNEFLGVINELSYVKLFVAPLLFPLAIGCAIFLQMIIGVPSGYACALLTYVHSVILCKMGQTVIDANDKMVEVLYNMPWYLLSASEQKKVNAFIHCTQNGTKLTMGPLGEINMETLSILTNKIYNFIMILKNVYK